MAHQDSGDVSKSFKWTCAVLSLAPKSTATRSFHRHAEHFKMSLPQNLGESQADRRVPTWLAKHLSSSQERAAKPMSRHACPDTVPTRKQLDRVNRPFIRTGGRDRSWHDSRWRPRSSRVHNFKKCHEERRVPTGSALKSCVFLEAGRGQMLAETFRVSEPPGGFGNCCSSRGTPWVSRLTWHLIAQSRKRFQKVCVIEFEKVPVPVSSLCENLPAPDPLQLTR